jgi:hypothetical protein
VSLEKYDDVSWHEEGEYPPDAPSQNAGSHIAYFLEWALRRGLLSEDVERDFGPEVTAVERNELEAPRLLAAMDGKVTSEDLNDRGRLFAGKLYDTFVERWEQWCDERGVASMYHVPWTRQHQAVAAGILDDLLSSQA